ncbi:Pimeloyl-ACP methyl ester carboxylesterase [Streptosporangium subroseum]|uniref:Pimeloyl-ACP methyl ester carboxylesterase n=2 Tax=Streptosporangium subroseum TaxID=106412 RepID=A0A239ANI4_9ACTN|nr:Pimeloyl-ACP methyl ester carboxylesterase [Streptosporangium subroseum]
MHAAVLGPPSAPEVVCVHGLGCSHRYFLPLARHLVPASRVVAVDLPGFGRTPGPREPLNIRGLSLALAGWLRATGRGGAPLVANSVGCQVVVDLATHAPELLGPVVLIGPTMDADARSAWRQGIRLAANMRFEHPSLIPVLARDYLVCGPRRYFATLAAALADPIEDKLQHVRTPAVVMRGAHDFIVPQAWAWRVASLLPQGKLVEVPGAGHTLNYSAPADVARVIRTPPAISPGI